MYTKVYYRPRRSGRCGILVKFWTHFDQFSEWTALGNGAHRLNFELLSYEGGFRGGLFWTPFNNTPFGA